MKMMIGMMSLDSDNCENLKSIKVPAGKGDYFKELLDDEELAKLVVEIR